MQIPTMKLGQRLGHGMNMAITIAISTASLDTARSSSHTEPDSDARGNLKEKRGFPSQGQALHSFARTDGAIPQARGLMIADRAGNLYGTAENGGASNIGVVFKLSGTGFVP
jgi:uncharacterized repeat protein (TIGR03803 family)